MQELRTTTGQRVIIRYDQRQNALTFHETDWFADPLRSTSVPEKTDTTRPLPPRNVIELRRRRPAA